MCHSTVRCEVPVEDLKKWFRHIERELEGLSKIAIDAFPKESLAQREARRTSVRLWFLLKSLRVKLGLESD